MSNICDWCKEEIKRGEMSVNAKNPATNETRTLHATCLKRWRQYYIAVKKEKNVKKRWG